MTELSGFFNAMPITDPQSRPKPTMPKRPKKKGGMALPPILAKIPPLYLYGALAGVLMMVGMVVVAIFSPPPAPPPVAQQSAPPPVAAAPAEPVKPAHIDDHLTIMSRSRMDPPPLSRDVKMSRADFEARTHLIETAELDGLANLGYRLRLPKDWIVRSEQNEGVIISPRLPGVAGEYLSPPGLHGRSLIRLRAQTLPFQIQALDWLNYYIVTNKLTADAQSRLGPDRAEASYYWVESGISYLARLVVVTSGSHVALLEYLLPLEDLETYGDLQIWVTTSFYLKTRDTSPVERIKNQVLLDRLQVVYPESWRSQAITAPDASVARLSLYSQPLGDEAAPVSQDRAGIEAIKGRLDVLVDPMMKAQEPPSDLASSWAKMVEFLKNEGLLIGDLKGRFDVADPPPGVKLVWARVFDVATTTGQKTAYQYWVMAFQKPDYVYYVGMLSPEQHIDPQNWARNLGAFDLVARQTRGAVKSQDFQLPQ